MQLTTLFTSLVTLASLSAAAPTTKGGNKKTLCDISKATWAPPQGQTNLTAPTHPLSFIGLGVGTQNYTCSDAGKYAAAGAVADILDISCLYGQPSFDHVQDYAIQIWKSAPNSITVDKIASYIPGCKGKNIVAGKHYFVQTGATTTAPKWDFTASRGSADAYVIGAKVSGLAAPTGKQDVDWLQLKKTEGSLADEIYRTDTRLGQPETSCTPGTQKTYKYVSKYYFFGGSA